MRSPNPLRAKVVVAEHQSQQQPKSSELNSPELLVDLRSIEGLAEKKGWAKVIPDEHGDWINKRDASFEAFIVSGDKDRGSDPTIFANYSSGLKTNRDAWCFNFSKAAVSDNVARSIGFYNAERQRYKSSATKIGAREFVDHDPTKISWDRTEFSGIERGREITFNQSSVVPSVYRAFSRQWAYFDRRFNNCVYQMPQLFPSASAKNLAIGVSGAGARAGFSVLMIDTLTSFDIVEKGQFFPLDLYEAAANQRSNTKRREG